MVTHWLECAGTFAMLRKRSISITVILSEATFQSWRFTNIFLPRAAYSQKNHRADWLHMPLPFTLIMDLKYHPLQVVYIPKLEQPLTHQLFSENKKQTPSYFRVYKNPHETGNKFSNFLWPFRLYVFSICPSIDVFPILLFYCFCLQLQHVKGRPWGHQGLPYFARNWALTSF